MICPWWWICNKTCFKNRFVDDLIPDCSGREDEQHGLEFKYKGSIYDGLDNHEKIAYSIIPKASTSKKYACMITINLVTWLTAETLHTFSTVIG